MPGRFLVLGAGAIGGVIAARLLQAGVDVTAVSRGAHLDAIRDGGLRLEDPDGGVTLPLPVVSSPAEFGWTGDDVVVLAVKSQDTTAALTDLAAVAPPSVPVVCAQNGVANERAALRWFPNVIAMCVMCPATHVQPGVVQAHSTPTTGVLDVGWYPSGTSSAVEELAAALEAASFASVARPDILRWKYAKLLMNLGNALEALCGASARRGRLAGLVLDEGRRTLDAAGIDFAWEATARRSDVLDPKPAGGQPRAGGSSWQSMQRGTGTIEADYLNGEIVLLGRLHGVSTPANELVQRRANQAARERTPPGSLDELALLAELG